MNWIRAFSDFSQPPLSAIPLALRVCVEDGAVTVRVAVGFDATLLRAVVEALR